MAVDPATIRNYAAQILLDQSLAPSQIGEFQGEPLRNPFAPPPGAADHIVAPLRPFIAVVPRDARGVPINPAILAEMDRVRSLRDTGQLVTGGQQAVADFRRAHPSDRSTLWG